MTKPTDKWMREYGEAARADDPKTPDEYVFWACMEADTRERLTTAFQSGEGGGDCCRREVAAADAKFTARRRERATARGWIAEFFSVYGDHQPRPNRSTLLFLRRHGVDRCGRPILPFNAAMRLLGRPENS
jgi:hypothetical protein